MSQWDALKTKRERKNQEGREREKSGNTLGFSLSVLCSTYKFYVSIYTKSFFASNRNNTALASKQTACGMVL
jgi:hypothetical protein